METFFIGIAVALGLYLLSYVVLHLWFLSKRYGIPKFLFCGLRSEKRVEKRTIGFMKRIMLLLICIMIPALSYADVKDVIRAISEGSNLNIQLEGVEIDPDPDSFELISGLVTFNFTPNGFDYNDNRVFGINAHDLDLDYSGSKIILRKGVQEKDSGTEYFYVFFIVDIDTQPCFAISFVEGNAPLLEFMDRKGNSRVFFIGFCRVIGADGSILLPQISILDSGGCETFKAILESIAKTVDLEE